MPPPPPPPPPPPRPTAPAPRSPQGAGLARDAPPRTRLDDVPEVADAQAQGDLIVFPWPPGDAAARPDLLAAARPTASLRLLGSHLLVAAGTPFGWSWWLTRNPLTGLTGHAPGGPTLGTLTVPLGGTAYL